MTIPHDKFCILPWVSLEASPIGTVRPCCLADNEIVDDVGNKFQLNTASFLEIQNSRHMQSLRQQFLLGQQPETCRRCWNEENSGRTSKRMHTLDRLKHVLPTTEWTQDAKPLMFMDLKLGNICNLKCRICGSWSSSQYAIEEMNDYPDKKNSYPYIMLKAGAWPRENPKFWKEIEEILTDIRYIEFTGGEPFMIQEHFDMLQGIVARGIAHQVEIHYNTNGTQYPENAIEIWRHFKTVEIAFSIDDLEKRFEYQRSNAVWTEVVDNIQRYKALQREHANIRLQCCSTVNVFNIRYLDKLAQWVADQGFDFVYWNMMHDPWHFSIAALPDLVKKELNVFLNNCSVPAQYAKEFDRMIDFMNNGTSTDGEQLRTKIAELDRRRKQRLQDFEPELAELINYE